MTLEAGGQPGTPAAALAPVHAQAAEATPKLPPAALDSSRGGSTQQQQVPPFQQGHAQPQSTRGAAVGARADPAVSGHALGAGSSSSAAPAQQHQLSSTSRGSSSRHARSHTMASFEASRGGSNRHARSDTMASIEESRGGSSYHARSDTMASMDASRGGYLPVLHDNEAAGAEVGATSRRGAPARKCDRAQL